MIAGTAGPAPVPAAALPEPLRDLAEQLWHAVDEDVRFALTRTRRPSVAGYDVVEQYAVVPTLRNPRILLPAAPTAAARGSAVNYRALRGSRERAARGALGLAAATGAGVAPTFLQVLVPTHRPDAAASLPLRSVIDALGEDELYASIGIRTGTNRKPTLQLVHADGSPAGYAKLGWNRKTDSYVRTESWALDALALDGVGRVRVPRRLAAFEYAGHPVMVSEPLPESARAVRPDHDGPTPAEYYEIAPVVRTDRIGSIGQLKALQERLDTLDSPLVVEPVRQARHLLAQLAADDPELVVSARWHGDLAPWNVARDDAGSLWVWDWEECESDAPTGLDPLHWAFSNSRAAVHDGTLRLADCLEQVAPHLTASGVPRGTWDALLRLYLAVTIERECELAVEDGTWERAWIQPEHLGGLVAQLDQPIASD